MPCTGGSMSNKSFIATCVSFALLTCALLACTPTQKLDRMLDKRGGIEAVQIHFREGLLDPNLVREAEERLSKNIPYKVIPSSETTGNGTVLKIIVDGIEKDEIEEWSYWKIWSSKATAGVIFSGIFYDPISLLVVPFDATHWANSIDNFKNKFGSLPLHFSTFVTADNEEIVFDDNISNKYHRLIENNADYVNIKRIAVEHAMKPENENTDILKLSFDIWLDTLTYSLNHYCESKRK